MRIYNFCKLSKLRGYPEKDDSCDPWTANLSPHSFPWLLFHWRQGKELLLRSSELTRYNLPKWLGLMPTISVTDISFCRTPWLVESMGGSDRRADNLTGFETVARMPEIRHCRPSVTRDMHATQYLPNTCMASLFMALPYVSYVDDVVQPGVWGRLCLAVADLWGKLV